MLKKLSKLFLGLVVCAGSACVTPTHASSAPTVVISHIQAASPASAKDEMVAIYNNTPTAIDISNWCLKNKANVAFVCFTPYRNSIAYYLPAFAYVVAASESFPESSGYYPEDIPFLYTVTNQSSGSIVNGNDVISLVTEGNQIVDSYSWSSAIPSGKIVKRNKSLINPDIYETVEPLLSWSTGSLTELPLSQIEAREIPAEGPDVENPNNPDDEDLPEIGTLKVPIITELLANPKGADVGNEFIEIYNPNQDTSIDLSRFVLKVGPQLEKKYSFASGTILAPLEYRAFSNAEIKFTLHNTSSGVQLERDGHLVDDTIFYESTKDGWAYALYGGSWFLTAQPTPGESNIISEVEVSNEPTDSSEEDEGTTSSTLKPCALNQYRHPETNRCRLIASSVTAAQTPCAANQYRSLETNRCRNIVAESTPAPCKEGQERNPETNRCRNSVGMTESEHGIKGVSIEQTGSGTSWYWWLGIAGVVALILAYAAWEWREELIGLWRRIISKLARNKK